MTNLNQHGKKNPYWKGGKSKFTCIECGKKFYDYHRKKGRERKFCSAECGYKNKERRIMVNCEQCGKEFETMLYLRKRNEGRFCSTECGDKHRSEAFSGENSWFYGKKQSKEQIEKRAEATRGEKNYNWKGGRKKQEGYVFIKLPNGGYQAEHRIIAEKALGRELKRDEIVHHINGNRQDNRNCNLLICTRGYHQWLERKMADAYKREAFLQ